MHAIIDAVGAAFANASCMLVAVGLIAIGSHTIDDRMPVEAKAAFEPATLLITAALAPSH
jgi:hypothetical protein